MADPAVERLIAEVAGLRTDVQAHTQGLTLMLEIQGTHTEMLRELLQMAAQDPGPNPLVDVMAQILRVLTGNQDAVERLTSQLAGLPERLGSEMAHAIERALRANRRPGSSA